MRAPALTSLRQYGVRVGAPGPTRMRARGTKGEPTSVPAPRHILAEVSSDAGRAPPGGNSYGLVWASSNPGTTIDWLVTPVCRREDLYAQMTRSTDHRSMDCLVVSSMMPARRRGQSVPEEWRGYFDEVERRPDWMPHVLALASFRLTDPFNLLHVEYRFSPEAHGFPPDAAPGPRTAGTPPTSTTSGAAS